MRLAKGKNLATVVTPTTGTASRRPYCTWVDTDGEHVLVNTEPQRQPAEEHPPGPPHSPRRSTPPTTPGGLGRGTRARVVGTETGDQARQHIDELSRKYVGRDYRNPVGPQGRVILQIAADKVDTPATVRRR